MKTEMENPDSFLKRHLYVQEISVSESVERFQFT